MDENKDSSKTNDLDICCDCKMCSLGRALKGVADPTPEQRRAAFERLAAAGSSGEDTLKVLRHAVEKMFRQREQQPQRIDWFGDGATDAQRQDELKRKIAPTVRDYDFGYPNTNEFQRSVESLRAQWAKYKVPPASPSFLRPVPPPPVPSQTKAELTLDVFDQLKALIDDGGWNDATDKAIALMRLQECKLLWEADNAAQGL